MGCVGNGGGVDAYRVGVWGVWMRVWRGKGMVWEGGCVVVGWGMEVEVDVYGECVWESGVEVFRGRRGYQAPFC